MPVIDTIQKPVPGIRSGLAACMLLTIVYVVSGKLGMMLALPPGYASPIFPPAGIAVAAALIGGRKSLPWIFLGALLLNVWVGYSANQQISTMDLTVATAIAIASMLQAAIGGWGLRRMIGYPAALDHSADVLRFLLLAPAICLTSASLSVSGLWALGIIDTTGFAANWATWWIGDTLGVVVVLPLVMIVAGKPRALWQSRMRTVAVPILLTFALFVAIFLKASQWEYSDSLTEFRQLSLQAVNQVQGKLEEQEFVLEQTAALFTHNTKGNITREEFQRFVEKSLARFPMIQSLEWASPVDAAHRANFEAAQRKDFPGFEIRELDAAGQLRRAGERSSYYPVTYVEPLANNEPAVGFDLASNPERQTALSEAIQRGTAVLTPSVHLVQDHQQQTGVLLLLAVTPHDNRSGAVLSVLRMDDFMNKLLLDTRAMLYTRLVDLDQQKTIYDNFMPGTRQALYEHPFDFGTRHYRLETAPTPAYFMRHRSWQSWSVLTGGILGTGLLGALLLLGTGYTTRIEAQVEERTRELKDSKKRLQEAQHLALIGSWELDIAGNTLIWSDEIYRIFEIAPTSFGASYEAFLNAIHPEDRSLVDSAYAESVKTRMPYSIEHRLLFPDGRIKFVHERGETFYDSEGRAIRSSGTVQDITERKQAEKELWEKRQLLESIVDNIPNMIFLKRAPDLRFELLNRAGEALLGHDRNELLGRNDYDFFPKEQADFFTGKDRTVLEHNGIIDIPEELIETTHGTRILHTKKLTLRNEQGQPQHLLGISEDITERKQAEESLRKSSEEIEDLYNHAPCGYHSLDKDGVVCRINDTELAWLGYTRDEVVGRMKWPDLITPESLKIFQENFPQFKKHGVIHDLEFELVRKDGTVIIGLINATAIYDPSGDFVMSRSTVFDITERKQAEQQIYNLAFYDALTRLPNRRLLNDHLGQAMAASKRSGHYGALMFMDLDNFKPLNDTYGHAVGDLLLIEVARRISACVRETDTVSRFGGDEFVVLLGELHADKAESTLQASIVAEKIRIALAEPYVLTIQPDGNATVEHHCTSSIGAVLFINHEASTEDILKWADMAMYQAKDEGRDRVRFYDANT